MTLKRNSGAVLVLTLAFLALLAANVLYFTYFIRTRLDICRNQIAAYKMACLARVGISVGEGILNADKDAYDYPGESWANTYSIPLSEGTVTVRMIDEDGKLDLNSLIDKKGKEHTKAVQLFKNMLIRLDLSSNLCDALLDWLDPDDFPRVFGAESEYYQTLSPPYSPANGPLQSLAQLALVKGFTPEVLEGNKEKEIPGLFDLVTTVSDSKINPGTADPVILEALGYSEDDVNNIVAARASGPVTMSMLLALDRNVTTGVQDMLVFKSNYFMIISTAETGKIKKTVSLIVKKESGKCVPVQWEE